jgi:hypothetical protein
MAVKTLNLNEEEQHVLGMAIELYIRLGLGQMSEIAQRLQLIHGDRLKQERMEHIRRLCNEIEELTLDDGKPWSLLDDETSLYTLIAFGLEARLAGNDRGQRWAQRRIKQRAKFERIDHRET